ncbi:NTF2-related export protein 2-like [Lineus longissimus]|uniref:NTF2-related export protein 2-like n=1 Tax=Lineus longissimus TaxID=88925 RepID=UPI002B4F0F0D
MAAVEVPDWKLRVEDSCEAAIEFSKLYYETFDQRPKKLQKLYMDSAILVWNGNKVTGVSDILSFYENLPSCEHTIDSVDCQPIANSATQGQLAILVTTMGCSKFKGNKPSVFQQTFVLTSQGKVWKIVSDNFRSQEVS